MRSRKQPHGLLLAVVVTAAVLLSACASTGPSLNLRENATVLIMPPRDVVQNGEPHEAGKDSGEYLQKAVNARLAAMSKLKPVSFAPTVAINHIGTINKADALAEAKKVNADYVLLLELGEFLNAAPMTFRPDSVTLQKGLLLEVATGAEIWTLPRPWVYQKSNFGSHHVLFDQIAVAVAKNLAK
jgi:hypothetical protein